MLNSFKLYIIFSLYILSMTAFLLIWRLLDEVIVNLLFTILANLGSDQAGYGVSKPPS